MAPRMPVVDELPHPADEVRREDDLRLPEAPNSLALHQLFWFFRHLKRGPISVDIANDIPANFRFIVGAYFGQWCFLSALCLIFAVVATTFHGLSICTSEWLISFLISSVLTPLWTFVFCFQPLYRAFKTGSSFDFCLFKFCSLGFYLFSLLRASGLSYTSSIGIHTVIHAFYSSTLLGLLASLCVVLQFAYLWLAFLMWRDVDYHFHGRNAFTYYWDIRAELIAVINQDEHRQT